jgi:hypothetical protein
MSGTQSGAEPLVRGALNNKAKGELAELAFERKAASMGLGVSKPHGENELDSGERLWRVQVKSAYCVYRRGYQAAGGRRKQGTLQGQRN